MRNPAPRPRRTAGSRKIAVQHDDTAAVVARAIDAAEERVRAAEPFARVIYLEPDIYSEAAAVAGPDPAQTPGGS